MVDKQEDDVDNEEGGYLMGRWGPGGLFHRFCFFSFKVVLFSTLDLDRNFQQSADESTRYEE